MDESRESLELFNTVHTDSKQQLYERNDIFDNSTFRILLFGSLYVTFCFLFLTWLLRLFKERLR